MCDVIKRHGVTAVTVSDDDAAVVVREPALFRVLASVCVDRLFETFHSDAVAISCITHKVCIELAIKVEPS